MDNRAESVDNGSRLWTVLALGPAEFGIKEWTIRTEMRVASGVATGDPPAVHARIAPYRLDVHADSAVVHRQPRTARNGTRPPRPQDDDGDDGMRR